MSCLETGVNVIYIKTSLHSDYIFVTQKCNVLFASKAPQNYNRITFPEDINTRWLMELRNMTMCLNIFLERKLYSLTSWPDKKLYQDINTYTVNLV